MKNNIKIKLLFFVLILVVGIGYAYVTKSLKINGTNGIGSNSWIIYFDRIQNESGVVSTETNITNNRQQVNFNINLKQPGEYYEFDVDTVNDGTIDAMIDSLEVDEIDGNLKNYLSFDVTYKDGSEINKCDLLEKHSRKTITVKVKFDEAVDEDELVTETSNLNLKFKINYVQKDVCDSYPTLVVDPNGGKYNGTRKLTKLKVEKNSDTVLDEPVRNGYDFLYFKTENGTPLEKDENNKTTVHVNTSDVKVTAQWEEHEVITKYILTIDPNGGVYNGETSVTKLSLAVGETLTLEEPTKENYVFDGWKEVTETYSLSDGVVTMPEEAVTVKAKWNSVEDYVARIENRYYTTIQKAFDAAVTNDKVWLLKSTTEDATNVKDISFDLGGFTVTGTITNSGTLTIDNGKITNVLSSPFVNTGTVNVGTHDGNMIPDSIIIDAGRNVNGLTQNGTFNFYDGYIIGKTAVTGIYNELEEGYFYIVDGFRDNNTNEHWQKAYLTDQLDAIVKKVINGKDVYYKLLQDAVDASTNDNPNMYAIDDFETSDPVSVPSSKNLLLDAAGFTIRIGSPLSNSGTFTLTNSDTTKGSISTREPIINDGTLILKDITMTQSTTTGNIIENSGNLNIINSSLTAQNGYALDIKSGGTINIDSTTEIKANKYGIYNEAGELVTINGGTINGIENNATGKLVLNNNTLLRNSSVNYTLSSTNGDIDLNNVTVQSNSYGISTQKGNINITGGTYTTNANCIYVSNSTSNTISIDGATINSSGTTSTALNIMNSNTTIVKDTVITSTASPASIRTTNLTITDSTFNSNGTNTSYNTYLNVNTGTISGSTFTGNKNYGLNIEKGTIDMTDTNISCNSNYALYLQCRDSGNIYITFNSGTIQSDSTSAVYNRTYSSSHLSTLKLLGGTIQGEVYGIYNLGELVLGANDGEIGDTTPVVMGETYGIFNTTTSSVEGKIYFYDGILKGKTGGYDGALYKTADDSTLKYGTETIDSEVYNTVSLKRQIEFVRLNDSQNFTSLQAAINAAGNSGNLKIIADAITTETTEISASQTINLDLNGFEVEFSQPIVNKGTLNLKDDSTNHDGKLINNTSDLIQNYKTLDVSSGNYESLKNAISVKNNATDITISGGSFTGGDYGVNNYYFSGSITSSLVITGGTFSNIRCANINMTGGEVTTKGVEIYGGTINGVNITSTSGSAIEMNGTSADLINVTATGSSNAISVRGGGTYNIVGGTYTGNTTAMYNNSSSSVTTVDGATLITTGNNAIHLGTYGGGQPAGKVNIINGTYVKGTKNGIYFEYGGRVVIGEKDSSVSTNSPVIIGGLYAIQYERNTGRYEFYDGILKGKTATYKYLPDIIQPGYRLKDDTEVIDGETYQTTTLEKQTGFLQVGNDVYDDLETAVEAISGTGTIDVIANGEIVYPTTITATQDITIDLHGYTLGSITTITNNGTLTMKDSSNDESGIIYSRKNDFIDNNKDLTIKSGSYISNYDYLAYLLYQDNSNATMTIDGGTIVGDNSAYNCYTIYKKSGTLNINGGNISNTSVVPIYNYNGNLTINNINNTVITGTDKALSCGGTVVINDGTINGTIETSSNMTINGGTITAVKNNTNGITNNGTLTVTGGYIKGKSYGISTSTKKLIIGVDDSSVTIASPVIEGGTYGVSCSSSGNQIEFYDGIIKGKTGRFQYVPKTIASGTNLVEDTETLEDDTVLLTAYLEQEKDFVKNNNTNVVYKNFKTAVSAASSGDKLIFIDDGVNYENVTIDKDLTIDLNDHTFSTSKKITNENDLIIIDDSQDKNGHIVTGSSVDLIENSGTLTIEDIAITSNSSVSSNYVIINTGTLETNDIVINSSCGAIKNSSDFTSDSTSIKAYSYSVYNTKNIDITDSDFYSTNSSCIYSVRNNVDIKIDGGTYRASGSVAGTVDISSSGSNGTSTLNVEDASFLSNSYRSINSSIPTTIIRCNLNNTLGINSGNGSATISNSTVARINNYGNLIVNIVTVNGNSSSDNSGAIYNEGNIDITGLTMTTNSYIGIYNKQGTFNFNSGTVTNNYSGNSRAVYLENGTFNLVSGTITNTAGGNSYGIYMVDGVLTVGTKNTVVDQNNVASQTDPLVKGITTGSNRVGIGVKSYGGTFNYYDGKFVGTTNAKPDAPTDYEYRHRVLTSIDSDNNEQCVLDYVPQ